MTKENDKSTCLSFTAVELLAEDENNKHLSVVDLALEKCNHRLDYLTASISCALAEEMIAALNIERAESHVPEVTAQIAFELSNTIEPLLVAYLTVSDLSKEMIETLEFDSDTSYLSRTGGPEFAETAVSITKYGLRFLTGESDLLLSEHGMGPKAAKSISRATWSSRKSTVMGFPQKITRQLVFLLANAPRTKHKTDSTHRKIAVITLGLRMVEIKNLHWLLPQRDKIVIDFLDFPGIPTALIDGLPHMFDLPWAEKILSDCCIRNDMDEIQIGFLNSFREFQYLQQQLLNFADETTDWLRIAEFTASKLKDQKVEVVISGHGLLIREKLLQIAIQRQEIPVISIAHSGIDDPCNYVSKYPADLFLGWGPIDEQILRDQHSETISYKPGIMKVATNDIKFEHTKKGSCVIVFLSPGQTGTTFIRVGPRQSNEAIKNLFEVINENTDLNFGLRFHPNYLDKELIDWVIENKPANSWVVAGPLAVALTENAFVFGFSLQMTTTAIIDLANHGVPVRHVQFGVELRDNLAKFIRPIVLPDLDGLNNLLRDLKNNAFIGQSDSATMSLLSNVFSGNIEEVPVVTNPVSIKRVKHPSALREEQNLDFIFWISSRFPRDVFRTEWIARPSFKTIFRGYLKFPKYTAVRVGQGLLVWTYRNISGLTSLVKK